MRIDRILSFEEGQMVISKLLKFNVSFIFKKTQNVHFDLCYDHDDVCQVRGHFKFCEGLGAMARE